MVFFLHSALIHIGLMGISDVLLNFYFVSLGYGPGVVGVLQALPRLGGFLTGLPVGMVANRIGKRRILIIANIGIAVSLFLLVLFPTLWMLGVSRFLVGLFYGANQIVTAPYMVTLTSREEHSHQFAYHNLISMASVAAGSVLGGYLPLAIAAFLSLEGTAVIPPEQTQTAYRVSLAIASAVILAGTFPLYSLPIRRETRKSKHNTDDPQEKTPWGLLLLFAVPLFFFGISGGLTFPFYNLFFRESFGIIDATVGTILALGWMGMGLVPLLSPSLEKRVGRSWALMILMAIAGVAFFGLGAARTLLVAVPFYLVGISVRNTMQPLFQPLVLDVLPERLHNLNSSIGMVSWNIGWFGSTASFGYLLSTVGYSGMMYIVAVGVLINGAAIVMIFAHRERGK
jgi:MFS family permease